MNYFEQIFELNNSVFTEFYKGDTASFLKPLRLSRSRWLGLILR